MAGIIQLSPLREGDEKMYGQTSPTGLDWEGARSRNWYFELFHQGRLHRELRVKALSVHYLPGFNRNSKSFRSSWQG